MASTFYEPQPFTEAQEVVVRYGFAIGALVLLFGWKNGIGLRYVVDRRINFENFPSRPLCLQHDFTAFCPDYLSVDYRGCMQLIEMFSHEPGIRPADIFEVLQCPTAVSVLQSSRLVRIPILGSVVRTPGGNFVPVIERVGDDLRFCLESVNANFAQTWIFLVVGEGAIVWT